MERAIRVGTRESQLAIWQATQVKQLLNTQRKAVDLVFIKSEGDIDVRTPLYEMGVQGIFTKTLDIALLDHKIDLAVHSLKDVPIQMALGLTQAAALKRGPVSDLLVFKTTLDFLHLQNYPASIATSSIRRKAQWLHKYPHHQVYDLRGNVNTRLKKLATENWDGAIFAQAGLERINIRPENSIVLEWMLPAPAQGAIVVVCRKDDRDLLEACQKFNDTNTELCTKIERQFLRTLLGGCSTPISALAEIQDEEVHFKGNIFSPDGKHKAVIEKTVPILQANHLGEMAADELLKNGGQEIADHIEHEVQ